MPRGSAADWMSNYIIKIRLRGPGLAGRATYPKQTKRKGAVRCVRQLPPVPGATRDLGTTAEHFLERHG